MMRREKDKLERSLGGIKQMESLPDAHVHHRRGPREDRDPRGQEARHPGRRGGRHQLRAGRRRLRDPGQRRRHARHPAVRLRHRRRGASKARPRRPPSPWAKTSSSSSTRTATRARSRRAAARRRRPPCAQAALRRAGGPQSRWAAVAWRKLQRPKPCRMSSTKCRDAARGTGVRSRHRCRRPAGRTTISALPRRRRPRRGGGAAAAPGASAAMSPRVNSQEDCQ